MKKTPIVNLSANESVPNSKCSDCGIAFNFPGTEKRCVGCLRVRNMRDGLEQSLDTRDCIREQIDQLQKELTEANTLVRTERSILQRGVGEQSMRKLKLRAPFLDLIPSGE